MLRLKYKYSLITVCLLFSSFITGCATYTAAPTWVPLDTSSINGPLTLEKCLELAKNNDIKVIQWKARLDAAHAELRQSKILPNPSLGITWEDIGLTDDLGKDISTATYEISYPVLFWLSYPEKIKAARLNQTAERTAVLSEQRQLDIEIASAYFNIVADQRKVALAEDIAEEYGELFRLAQKKNLQGDVSGFSTEQARLEMLKVESELKDAKNTLRAEQMSFAFALGADCPFYPVLADCGEEYLYPEGVSADKIELTEDDLNSALNNDPDYLEKQVASDYAASKVRIEKISAIPLTDVSGSGGVKKSPEGDSKAYSLDVSIPIFDRNQAGIERAYAELRTAQAEEEKARRDTILNITAKWEEYRTLAWKWEQYSSGSSLLAEKNRRTAERLYEMGKMSYSELLLSQAENKNIQIEAVDTWRDLCRSSWELGTILCKH